MFNDRGAVICAIDVSPLLCPGVIKAWESCADLDLIEDGEGTLVDRAGCVNILTPARTQTRGTDAIAPNSCLVEIEKWSLAEAEIQ
jgi:trimethylamine-N-oxide reductase (cytochrome c)